MGYCDKLIKNCPPEVQQFIVDLLAVTSSLSYGVVSLKIHVHQKKIKKAEFTGWKTIVYNDQKEDQSKAIADLGEKILNAKKTEKNCKIHFVVHVKNGSIKGLFFNDYKERVY